MRAFDWYIICKLSINFVGRGRTIHRQSVNFCQPPQVGQLFPGLQFFFSVIDPIPT
ncbi:unnamed protein product [Meloidogyne enterolobii]|uniref:Uncharacterized protein n=1 Tax=Meloidogyne enterolobii TaxID=390850 RepID=A0ACB0XWW0_MELEN